ETTLDESVRRLLRLFDRVGLLEHPESAPEQAIDRPPHRALAREAAAEGMVLLKNDSGILPLQREQLSSLAIIGPNAKIARIMGGGSARVNPHYAVSPYEGIVAKVDGQVTIGYQLGCTNHKMLPLVDANLLRPHAGSSEHGMSVAYFNNLDLVGEPVYTKRSETSELNRMGQLPASVNQRQFSVRCSGQFAPQESGTYTFGLISAGLSRFFIDGQEIIDNWTRQTRGEAYFGFGSAEATGTDELMSGRSYDFTLEYSKSAAVSMAALRLGCLPPVAPDAIEQAAKLAAEADVALVFVGLSDEWESEGFDKPDIDLPGRQTELIERVAAANKQTVVVLNTGSPVAMPWLDKVAAVVEAWFPGQECGNAIADVLFGDTTPSGKLPQTFPKRLEDTPAYINYPGENGRVRYGEGLFVGYRYYDRKKIEPLFPFGFGLSYTTFSYSPLRLSTQTISPGDKLHVEVDITNSGQRMGKEVIQVYVRDVAARLPRPDKELKAFAKVQLAPGECKTVTLTLDRDALAYYDDLTHEWVAEAGEFELLVGASSQDIRSRAVFTLTATSRFGSQAREVQAKPGLDSTISQLVADEEARAILNRHLPGILNSPQLDMAMGLTLEQIASFVPDILTSEVIQRIGADLQGLER
ncbi:MAG TPA: glycoside hydrolase family 3 C-terminal domain-containing protein, partial [Ktedonobacteraceae bacterium]|nr:glycoside hydrolase family 3 C-terminal domain-containing protein [Ktedonobacteraceae bacterium]